MKRVLLAGAALLAIAVSHPVVAADAPAVYKAPPAYVPPIFDWSGFYVGVDAGGAWGYFLNNIPVTPGPLNVGGHATFGGHAGYNWQSGRVVYGAEADLSWIDITAKSPGARFEEDWMASLRLRLGYLVDRYLLYLTAGGAFTHVETSVVGFGSDSANRSGVTAGVGIETKLAANWSGRLEALFVDVPMHTYNNGGFITAGGSHNYAVRLGVSYHP